MTSTLLHATCVSIDGKGVLLLGDSGSGKSDLALRLIDDGATLVSDDQVIITAEKDKLYANAPEKIRGLLEVHGVGILSLPCHSQVQLALAVQLVEAVAVERLPGPTFFDCLGQRLPLLSLHAFHASTPVKIRFYLAHVPQE